MKATADCMFRMVLRSKSSILRQIARSARFRTRLEFMALQLLLNLAAAL